MTLHPIQLFSAVPEHYLMKVVILEGAFSWFISKEHVEGELVGQIFQDDNFALDIFLTELASVVVLEGCTYL